MLKNTYKLYIKENYTSENLLKYALKDYANIDKYEIVYNEYGKPYLKNIDIYFNISNSKNVSVCVISNREVGVDIQYKTYKESLKNKVFNNKEQEQLDKSIEKESVFTKMWTIKESYVKMKGIGLSYGLNNVDTLSLKKNIKLLNYKNYIICICFENEV